MVPENVDGLAAMGMVVKGNSQFLAKLYPVLVEANGNANDLIMSIFSLSSVLALAYVGAKENTRDEMKQVISFPSVEEVTLGYQKIFKNLKSNHNFTLDVANGIFVQNKYPFLDSYFEQLKTHFLVEPQTVNFTKSEEVRQEINSWVEQKTHDKIKDLIPGGTVDSRTRAVLVNAVYFKGSWAAQFDKKLTSVSNFNISPTETVEVNMMHISWIFKASYSKELGCTILDMPYKGDRLSMLLFLSEKPEGFYEMEKKLYSLNISRISSVEHRHKYYDVAIPRFKAETTHQLVQSLVTLGLVDMFDPDRADFSGMTGKKDLYVSYVVQKAFIEVNEEGSEATASTAILVGKSSSAPLRPKEFICDRPFLFVIKDSLTGMILFNGRVVNPTKTTTGNSGAKIVHGLTGIVDIICFGFMVYLALKLVQQ